MVQRTIQLLSIEVERAFALLGHALNLTRMISGIVKIGRLETAQNTKIPSNIVVQNFAETHSLVSGDSPKALWKNSEHLKTS